MLIVEIQFIVGRCHGTPWGRHANEGEVDWPPSPWRFLRALIATWFLKSRDAIAEDALRALIGALAERPPDYYLPPASRGHSRHYMPYVEGKACGTTKIFDSFIQVSPNNAMQIAWDLELPTELRQTFAHLLENLSYLGRAESLVEARLLSAASVFTANAFVLADEADVPPEHEIVRLMAPFSSGEYSSWLADFQEKTTPAAGTRKKKHSGPTVPKDVFECLLADTAELQASGWSLPPGSRAVNYVRLAQAFDISPIRKARKATEPRTVAVYQISSAVLPRITKALSVGERVHRTLCKFSDNSAVFTGKEPDGTPRKGHRHAHIFCEALDRRDAITHVIVFAPEGFGERETRALRSVRRVWGEAEHDLQMVLLGLGSPIDFPGVSSLGKSKTWQSYTPFIPTRHPATYADGRPKLDEYGWAIGSPQHDLRRLLSEHQLGALTKISELKMAQIGERHLRWIQFQTQRHHGDGRRVNHFGCGFRLTFSEEIAGPLCFGYAAHFGLGLFVPVNKNESEPLIEISEHEVQ